MITVPKTSFEKISKENEIKRLDYYRANPEAEKKLKERLAKL